MSQMRRVLFELAEHRRMTGMGTRHGYVHEVKEGGGERKVKVVLGIKSDGTPWLSPWLHSEEQRGGTQEQHLVEKGQNVIVTGHGGDFRNGTFSHSAESKSFPQPSHAPNVNGYTSEHGKLRTSHNKPKSNGGNGGGGGSDKHYHSVEIMDQAPNNPQHQEQSGQPQQGGGSGGGQQNGQQQGGGQQSQAKSVVSTSVHETDGCTGRVGEGDAAARYASHEKGAKICMGDFSIWVNKSGCWSSKPIQLKKCDIPNNNA